MFLSLGRSLDRRLVLVISLSSATCRVRMLMVKDFPDIFRRLVIAQARLTSIIIFVVFITTRTVMLVLVMVVHRLMNFFFIIIFARCLRLELILLGLVLVLMLGQSRLVLGNNWLL